MAKATVRRGGPFREPAFRWLWSGQLVSLIGDQLFPMAMVALVLPREQAAVSLGTIFAARFAGMALFVTVGGVLADRINRLRMLLASDVIRLVAVLALIAMGSNANLLALAVGTFVMGAGEAIFRPAYDSIIPSLVPEEMLKRANAANGLLRNLGQMVGPGAAGLLVAIVGVNAALWIDAATFLVSMGTVLMIMIGAAKRLGIAPPQRPAESMLAASLAGVRIVLRIRWLAVLEVTAVVHVLLAVGPWFVLTPLIAQQWGTDSSAAYGLLLSMFALGGVGGTAAAGWLRARFVRPGVWGLAGLSLFGLTCLSFFLTDNFVVTATLFAVGGAGTQFFNVLKTTAIQKHVESAYLGRVFALSLFASLVTLPAGQMLAGLLVLNANQAAGVLAAAGLLVLTTSFLPLLVPGMPTMGDETSPRQGARHGVSTV